MEKNASNSTTDRNGSPMTHRTPWIHSQMIAADTTRSTASSTTCAQTPRHRSMNRNNHRVSSSDR